MGGDLAQLRRLKLDQVTRSSAWRGNGETGKPDSKGDAELQVCTNAGLAWQWLGETDRRDLGEMSRNCSDEQKAQWQKEAVVGTDE